MRQNLFKLLRAIVVSAAVVFSFAACQGSDPDNADNGNGTENGNGGNGGGGEEQPQFTMAPVDLGLSVKWADSNLGTTVATESGGSYAGTSDPVSGLCGKDWRMPTRQEFEELIDPANCSIEETTQGDVKGFRITSKKNSNSIFLPVNEDKGYWSSTGCKDYPAVWCLEFTMDSGHQGNGTKINNNRENKVSTESDLKYNFWDEINSGKNIFTYYPDGSFKLSWDSPRDVLGEVGPRFNSDKTPDQIGYFAADYQFTKQGSIYNGGSYFGIHGWLKTSSQPAELYIVEDWIQNSRPTFSTYNNRGEYVVDGDNYELFTTTRTGSTAFGGATTTQFNIYYALRKTGRQKGHVDISAHFREWQKKGLVLGNIERVTVLAEVFSGSDNTSTGSVDFTYVNIYPQADYASWLAENGLSGADAAWNATPAKWGGEVTNAYMYNRGKDKPFRFPAGWDPYLNLRDKEILQSIRPVTK